MGDKRGAWRVGGYVADELIGYGASAQVWRGHVGRTSEPVALKVLDLHDVAAARAARREAAILSALDHPNLLRLWELIPDGENVVLVLDLAAGGSLADLLSRRGRVSPGEAVGALSPIAAALAYSHNEGVVHCDVAPGNILFRADGSSVLADLGVARLVGGFDPPRSTLAYVDPGVAAGGIPSESSDVFMIAATALHAITGAPAWRGTTVDSVLAEAVTGEIVGLDDRLAAVPRSVAEVIRRGLSVLPAARGSAAEFALDLRHSTPPVPIDLGAGRPRSRSGESFAPRPRAPANTTPASPTPASPTPASPTPASRTPNRPGGHQPRHAAPVRVATPAVATSVARRCPEGTRPEPTHDRTGRRSAPLAPFNRETPTPLALTHVVRARVRAPVAEPPRRWGRARADARLRISIAVVGVFVLVVSGVAWLSWGPAWPRRAAAAPIVSSEIGPISSPWPTHGDVRSAVSSPEAPTSVTRTSPTRRSAPRKSASTESVPPQPLPHESLPHESLPPRSPPTARATSSDGDVRWAAVLGALDRHRQAAFATDDPATLAAVYVPGPLLDQDVATLHQVLAPGCRLVGLRTRYQQVQVSSAVGQRVVLATRASLDAAVLQCPGAPDRRLAAHGPVTMGLVLVPHGPSYLISGITVSG